MNAGIKNNPSLELLSVEKITPEMFTAMKVFRTCSRFLS